MFTRKVLISILPPCLIIISCVKKPAPSIEASNTNKTSEIELRKEDKVDTEDTKAQSEENDSLRQVNYRETLRTWFMDSSKSDKKFAKILKQCPKNIKNCYVRDLFISIKKETHVPLGSALIPPNSYVRVSTMPDGAMINLKVDYVAGEAQCSGVYEHGKAAWVGNDRILTSAGVVSATSVFKGYDVSADYDEPGYHSKITSKDGQQVLLDAYGVNLDAKAYFVKNGKLAKKINQSCLMLGQEFSKADWCEENYRFLKFHSSTNSLYEKIKKYKTKDDMYQLIIKNSPAC